MEFYITSYQDGEFGRMTPRGQSAKNLDDALEQYQRLTSRGPVCLSATLDGEGLSLVEYHTVFPDSNYKEHLLAEAAWIAAICGECPETAAAVERLRTALDVKRMTFGGQILDIPASADLPPFFVGKELDTAEGFPFFERVYVVGYGWLTPAAFDMAFPWGGPRLPYVYCYHVRYLGTDGQQGEADISPLGYELLLDRLDPAEVGTDQGMAEAEGESPGETGGGEDTPDCFFSGLVRDYPEVGIVRASIAFVPQMRLLGGQASPNTPVRRSAATDFEGGNALEKTQPLCQCLAG